MDYSSPLAAMRPQPCPSWPTSNDLPRSIYTGCQTYGPTSFDFRNMSMQQQQQQRPSAARDYFTLRPVRGSSPTAILTADLDANFHIDKSPQLVTPRRSLFTANVFRPVDIHARVATPPIEHEGSTTPTIPSSSPGVDMMDVSPLPHKAPYFVAQLTLPSPTPEETPEEPGISPELLFPLEAPTPQPPTYLQLPEKRPTTRPALSRAKGWSTNSIPQRPASAENQLPPFRFGNVAATCLSSSASTTLMDTTLTESPVDMQSASSCSALPVPRRPSIGSASRVSGSPSSGHVRKSSNSRPPFTRPPRKQMRRSLSMFQHPDDVMKEEHEAFEQQQKQQQQSPALMSMMEIEPDHIMKLPCFIPDSEPDGLPRISQDTMVDILNQKYSSDYEKVLIIDCRFEYEYEGGHIQNAVNFNDKQLLADRLFSEQAPRSTLLIFHCEYSVQRAPLTAKFIRNHDRKVNAANYPNLTYPEMYILDGGYRSFFSEHRSKCQPQNYVEMNDTRHERACERGMARVKQRQKLFRHQTFAFGQNGGRSGIEESPTQPQVRSMAPRSQSTFLVRPAIAAGIGQEFQRRMASY